LHKKLGIFISLNPQSYPLL